MNPDLVARTRAVDGGPLGLVIGGWKPRSGGVAPWRTFPHFALVLTVRGTARYADARGTTGALHPGDVLVVFPGLRHWFLPELESGWDEYFLIFGGPTFVPWSAEALLDPSRPILHPGDGGYWLRRFSAVLGAEDRPDPLAAVARLHVLLADLLRAASPRLPGDRQEWLDRARSLLADRAARSSLDGIARRLGCSPQVFRKRFRTLAGEAPGAFRERMRLEEACRLLPRMTVSATAERLGFCDPFQFSRRFKACYGIPPRQFQRL